MKYDHFTMLPERAFQPRNGPMSMTFEGGGGGQTSEHRYPIQYPRVAAAADRGALRCGNYRVFRNDREGID
jgi:hypothetical protein